MGMWSKRSTRSVRRGRRAHHGSLAGGDAGDGDGSRWSPHRPVRAAAWSARTARSSSTRTTTLAAYHDGVERYVTSFEFSGEGKEVGSIVPLPGVPSKVERGGDWTLQRLEREVAPPARELAFADAAGCASPTDAEVLLADEDRRARHHDPEGRRRRGRQVGDRPRLPAHARRARDARLLRRAQPDLHGRALRRVARRGARPDSRATARRSCSRSRPTSRGCRCASSASGSTRAQVVDADVFLLTDDQPKLLAGGTGLGLDRNEAGVAARCSTTCAPTRAWGGCPTRCGSRTCRSTPPAGAARLRPRDLRTTARPCRRSSGPASPRPQARLIEPAERRDRRCGRSASAWPSGAAALVAVLVSCRQRDGPMTCPGGAA